MGEPKGAMLAIPGEGSLEQQTENALISALANYDLRVELKEHILDVPVAHSDSKVLDLGTVDATTSSVATDYQRFSASGVNTALEIGIAQIALFKDESDEGSFALLINMCAQLSDVAEQKSLWSNDQIIYVSRPGDISFFASSHFAFMDLLIRVCSARSSLRRRQVSDRN